MEVAGQLETLLHDFAGVLKLALEATAVLCVLIGFLRVIWLATIGRGRNGYSLMVEARLALGTWLVLALEFQLAADIVATTVTPSFEDLAKLGIVAFIRTALNYFLQREIREIQQSEAIGQAGSG
jgi:uncharacterized membrane protein